MAKQKIRAVCTHVFRNGGTVCDRKRFTEKWAELISRLEQAQPNRTEKP